MAGNLSGSFMANGNRYIIMEYLSVGRDVRFKNTVPKMVFGTDFAGIFESFAKIYTYATTGESPLAALHKISVLCMNQMDAVKSMRETGNDPVLELCALFINKEGEDHSTISDQQISDKIADWKAEGLDSNDFFLLAINSVKDLKRRWMELNSSQKH